MHCFSFFFFFFFFFFCFLQLPLVADATANGLERASRLARKVGAAGVASRLPYYWINRTLVELLDRMRLWDELAFIQLSSSCSFRYDLEALIF